MKIIILALIFILPCYGSTSLQELLLSKTSTAVQKLQLGESQQQVLKVLGKPAKIQGNTYYYKTSFKKYDTAINFEEEKISSIYFHFKPSDFRYEDLKEFVSGEDIDKARKEIAGKNNKATSLLNLDYPQKGIQLIFNNNSFLSLKGFIITEAK